MLFIYNNSYANYELKNYNSNCPSSSYFMVNEDWINVSIEGMGQISLPPEMEIQSGKYKKLNDKYYEIMGIESKSVIFQPKGLNNFNSESFNSYARVLIGTTIGTPNQYKNLFSSWGVSKGELKKLNKEFKNEMEQSFSKANMKIINWYPLEIVNINNMPALVISYDRQLDDNPQVFVRIYQFQNNDRTHKITLSYRIDDKEKWEPILEQVLNSLSIIER